MNEVERLKEIMDIIYREETVKSEDLEKRFNASSVTIRRDLEKLKNKGLIIRFRGGAMIAKAKLGHEPSLDERESNNLQKKRLIGLRAAELISEGEVIALDVGSTTLEIAKALRSRKNITVFTPSLTIANIFYNTNINVYLVGGLLQQKEMCLGGPIARSVIRQYHFDKFFLGVAGIDENSNVTDFGMDEVETKKAFIERSAEVFVVADFSKFGKKSFIEISNYPTIKNIITDCDANSQIRMNLQKRGVNVIIANSDEK